jgi:Family of unknown function (DUF695)
MTSFCRRRAKRGRLKGGVGIEGESVNLETCEWVLAKGTREGKPLLCRFRRFPVEFKRAEYPERVDVCWEISKPDESGFPSQKEMDRMQSFEDFLLEAVEHDQHSVLAFVITCDSARYFMFYTADVQGFVERLQSMPHPRGKYPISLETDEDPEWKYYQLYAR